MVAPDGPTLPSPAPARSVLFGLPPAGRRLPGAARAALAFGAPALVAVALGHEQQGLMAATGALAVIFGEGQVYRRRWRIVGAAALALTLSAFAGGLTGELIHQRLDSGGTHWWQLLLVLLMAAVAVTGTFVNSALRLGPPGGFFFVLAAGVGALITGHGVPPGQVALWTAIGGGSALLVGMSAALTRTHPPEERAVAAAITAVEDYAALAPGAADLVDARYTTAMKVQTAWALLDDARRTGSDGLAATLTGAQRTFADALHRNRTTDDESDLLFDTGRPAPTPRPSLRYRLLRSLSPDSHAVVSANRIGVATLLAGCSTVALDLGRPDWAVLTVTVLLHQGPDRVRGTYRGVHRIGGTALGLVLFAALYALEPRDWTLVLILMALQFAIEMFVARNYGLAVVFITPLALLMGGGGQYGNIFPVLRDRLLESVIGVVIGLGALWAVDRRAHRRVLLRNDQRVLEVIGHLLDRISPGRDRREGSQGAKTPGPQHNTPTGPPPDTAPADPQHAAPPDPRPTAPAPQRCLPNDRPDAVSPDSRQVAPTGPPHGTLPSSPRETVPGVSALRRELEFELMGSTLGAIDAAHNEPEWARAHWTRHRRIRRLGHEVLAASRQDPGYQPVETAQLGRWSRSLAELA